MRLEWDDARLVQPWAAAMGEHGDYWREVLINPLALAVAERLAAGGDPFAGSAFEALVERPASTSLGGVHLVDLGCGEGCLGRLVSGRGATYSGLDGSQALLAIARQRADPGLRFAHADLERAAGSALRDLPAPSLVTAIALLDHMEDVTGFLEALAA